MEYSYFMSSRQIKSSKSDFCYKRMKNNLILLYFAGMIYCKLITDLLLLFCEQVLWRKFVYDLRNWIYSYFMLFGVDCFRGTCCALLWKLKKYILFIWKLLWLCAMFILIKRFDLSYDATMMLWCYLGKNVISQRRAAQRFWWTACEKWLQKA